MPTDTYLNLSAPSRWKPCTLMRSSDHLLSAFALINQSLSGAVSRHFRCGFVSFIMPESLKHDEEYLIAETNSMRSQQLQHADATASPQQTDVEIRRLSRRLYVSHALSTWNSRVFEFGAFLFLAHIFPQTLLPASVYALARAASAALFSPWLGSYIDRADRLRVVRQSIRMLRNQQSPPVLTNTLQLVNDCQLSYPVLASYSCRSTPI